MWALVSDMWQQVIAYVAESVVDWNSTASVYWQLSLICLAGKLSGVNRCIDEIRGKVVPNAKWKGMDVVESSVRIVS